MYIRLWQAGYHRYQYRQGVAWSIIIFTNMTGYALIRHAIITSNITIISISLLYVEVCPALYITDTAALALLMIRYCSIAVILLYSMV